MIKNKPLLQPPQLKHAMKLRCPHCGVSPLLAEKSWFALRPGCELCRYAYIREQGYFTGAAWVMTYAFGSILGLVIGAVFLIVSPKTDVVIIAASAATFAACASYAFIPFGKALWLYFDHLLHPLEDSERKFGTS